MRPYTKSDFADINRRLRTAGKKPPRTIDQAYRLHKERKSNQVHRRPGLQARFGAKILHTFEPVIESRGGETGIEEERGTIGLDLLHYNGGLYVIGCDGWRQHSKTFGARRASLRYLCGVDDNGPWAVRIPGTIDTVEDAARWIEPAVVRKALEQGRRVLRQGDVYAIEMKRDRASDTAKELPSSHSWHPGPRILLHSDPERPHLPLQVPYKCKFVQQRVLEMGRSNRRAYAD